MTTFMLRALSRTLLIGSCAFTFAACQNHTDNNRPFQQKDLGVPGSETKPPSDGVTVNETTKQKFQPVLDMGQRAVTWLNLVNTKRDETNRLNLADRNTKNPVPPEKPNVSSVNSILEKYKQRLAEIPAEMRPYLIDKKDLTDAPPITDEAFLKSIRDINSTYQAAVRWLGQEQWFSDYEANDIYDIRGYYFMKKDPAGEQKIKDFFANSTEEQRTIKEWLVSMCHNSKLSLSQCRTSVEASKTNADIIAYFNQYQAIAKKTYDDFFTAESIRKDISWSQDKRTITQNFIDPKNDKVATWLKTNIEEEWQNQAFQLIINFVKENPISPYIVFQKGVTPHVSGDNWEQITMDPDYSLDDFDTQWTIRHEFGHILGFPDCYLEFYNSTEKTMTYYTIEPENLMCAWGGKLQRSHETELRKAYK